MHFIFPKNYDFKSKLLGIIDYSTAILDLIIGILIYLLVNLIFENINLKIYVFTSLFFPVLLISILGINKENIISIVIYMFKFFKNQNIYLYKKNNKFHII